MTHDIAAEWMWKNGFIRNAFNLAGVVLYGLAAMIGLLISRDGGRSLEAIKKVVRLRFPQVQQIQAEQLNEWLQDENREAPLLLDVRTPGEFAFSHLPGAIQVNPEINASEASTMFVPSRPVVVYCSVGYRSSKLASRLMKMGLSDVVNLEGSIFTWANEGYFLEKEGNPATKVHPYSRFTAKLLGQEVRGYSK